ncbi:unnamed protein product [Scytosiphon promiscuus]
MFASLGGVLSSSLTDLSKSITNSIASQLNPLGYTRKPDAEDLESSDANSPLPIDVDALLSYYAKHRPSSRLLKERAFEVGQKGPRSATLLVSGSTVFERPWRCRAPADALESGGLAHAATEHSRRNRALVLNSDGIPRSGTARLENYESHAQGSSSPGEGCPMLGGSATRERQVWQEGRRRSDVQQHKRRRHQERNQQQGHHQRLQSHRHHPRLRPQEQRQQQTGGSPRVSQTPAGLETAFAEPRSRRLRSRPRATTQTRSKMSTGTPPPDAAVRPLPQLLHGTELAENSLLADALPGRTSQSTIVHAGNDGDRSATAQDVERELSRFAREPTTSLSARPSTAPCTLPLPSQPRQSLHDDRCPGAEHGDFQRGINTPGADVVKGSGTPPGHEYRQSSSSADTFRRYCVDDSDDFLATSRHESLDFYEPTAATKSAAPDVRRPATTSLLGADSAESASLTLRPSTAEAPRRSSIEADAATSRSSRLPPTSVTTSLSLGSERECIRTGDFSSLGGVINEGGGTISNNKFDIGEGSGLGEPYLKDTEARRYSSLDGRGASSGHPPRQRHRGQRPTSPPESARVQTYGGAFKDKLARSRTASAAAIAGAAGTAWAPWLRREQAGDLDTCADRACARRARVKNGTVGGAEWGGNDQMNRVAAASMPSGRFGQKRNSESETGGGVGRGKRPDARERFYDVPAEALKALRPCLCCFDALMLHLRDPGVVEAGTSWTSVAAVEDPHVAVFVSRWESLDSDLGRYIPRGFAGSFTPRPFRPALAEYAVKAAIGSPNFWGLDWTQIPLTRCRVTVVKSMEVAQDERDWLSNRHGLILSFKDGAERHYQSAIFPETLYKGGWSKERTIDILYQKAGYWKPRRVRGVKHQATAKTAASREDTADPAISRTAVILRFEAVTFRMGFQKYQRAKAAAAKRSLNTRVLHDQSALE